LKRRIAVLGAPTNLGLKPYDDGRARGVDQAPRVLRELGLIDKLDAIDLGDLEAPPYRDFQRPATGIRNERLIAAYSETVAEAVAANDGDDFLLVLGGDCSILLGTLAGLRGRVGLGFIDGHCDFATPAISQTGGAAGMDLALAVGRGRSLLSQHLVREEDIVLMARKDLADEPYYGEHSIRFSAIADLPYEEVWRIGAGSVAERALGRLASPGLDGFWLHLDVDVLDPAVMPAVDSPEPGGLSFDELRELLTPLVHHPAARGLEVAIYDPLLDPGREAGAALVEMLAGTMFSPRA
jgi:arginase